MSRPSPSHNKFFVPINLQKIKQESTTDHEIQRLDDTLNNSMETELNVKEMEIKDEPMSCKELENDHILHDNLYEINIIHEERERVVNFNVKEEMKDEPLSYKELDSDRVDSINIENSDLNDVSDVRLIDKDYVKHEKREKIINCNVKVEEISDEPMSFKELKNDHILHDDLYVINAIHEGRERVVNVKEEIKDEPTLPEEDNVVLEEREKVTKVYVEVHLDKIKTDEADDEKSAGIFGGQTPPRGSGWGPAGAREFYCSCSRLSLATHTLAIVRCVRIGAAPTGKCKLQRTHSGTQDTTTRLQNYTTIRGTVADQTQRSSAHIECYFKCSICKRAFNQKANLKRHLKIHSKSEAEQAQGSNAHIECHFKCSICKRAFNQKANLKRHLKIHSKSEAEQTQGSNAHIEGNFQCTICKSTFNRKSNLKRHLKIRHLICQNTFKLNANIKRHLKLHSESESRSYTESCFKTNSEDKLFQCAICAATFKLKLDLQNHLKLHSQDNSHNLITPSQENLFQCAICKRRFKWKANMEYHVKSHVESFECTICGKTFTQKDNLKTHLKLHSEEKPLDSRPWRFSPTPR